MSETERAQRVAAIRAEQQARDAVVKREWARRPPKEIAAALSLTSKQVWSIAHRLRLGAPYHPPGAF